MSQTAMQAKEGSARMLGSLRAKPPTSLVVDLPWHTCNTQSWAGAACGKCGLCAKVALDFQVQQLGPVVNYTSWSWRSARCISMAATEPVARAKPKATAQHLPLGLPSVELWMLPVSGILFCRHLGFTSRLCCP